ncbi:hypothetical protein ER308_11565 [Egibacter rhizosphaerae]|uniref:Ldh family oxidoreductase n=2 Tax=Egibacter rhizosphaerae TaxID=1670831 RepID=A0A411YG60_9ACTN|nr:hypothetical protein ER308_11565 [Egibacter rhizosphaerae]
MAGHKGYGISLAIDFLSGILPGSAYGAGVGSPFDPDGKSGCGHTYVAVSIDAVRGWDAFVADAEALIDEVKSTPLAQDSDEMLFPGEKEARAEIAARRDGITLPARTRAQLIELAHELGIDFGGERFASRPARCRDRSEILMTPLVALVHATPAAFVPARDAFAAHFPEADLWNLLDDRLMSAATSGGGLTPTLRRRMYALIDHAHEQGAAGVLLTCSMYGPAARAASPLFAPPVRGSDDALLAELADTDTEHLLVAGSASASVDDAIDRFHRDWSEAGKESGPKVESVVVDGAASAVAADDVAALAESVVSACRPHVQTSTSVWLAQYSLRPGGQDCEGT